MQKRPEFGESADGRVLESISWLKFDFHAEARRRGGREGEKKVRCSKKIDSSTSEGSFPVARSHAARLVDSSRPPGHRPRSEWSSAPLLILAEGSAHDGKALTAARLEPVA